MSMMIPALPVIAKPSPEPKVPTAPKAPAYLPTPAARGSIGDVEFQYNPNELSWGAGSDFSVSRGPGASHGTKTWSGGQDKTISFTLFMCETAIPKVRRTISEKLSALESYCNPGGNSPPPRTRLSLGGRSWYGWLEKMDVTETLYDENLVPTVVNVSVSFLADE